MSRAKSVLTFVTGVPGVGKSWRESFYVVTEIIPELAEDSYIYTNLPLIKEVFVKHFKDESLYDRIVLIDNLEMERWRVSKSQKDPKKMLGPWSFFEGCKTSGSVFILDEIHELCNKKDNPRYRERWENFLATIRHLGFKSAEFLTQDEAAVAVEIKNRAGLKICLEDNESELDTFFKISMFDWYNLIAGHTRKYKKSFMECTYKKRGSGWTRKPMKEVRRYIDPLYFKFYDSFNHTSTTTEQGEAQKHEEKKPFEEHGLIGIYWWFLKRNCFNLGSRFVVLGLFMWITCFGGMALMIDQGIKSMVNAQKGMQKSNTKKKDSKKNTEVGGAGPMQKQNDSKKEAAARPGNDEMIAIVEDPETGAAVEVALPVALPVEIIPQIVMMTADYIMMDSGLVLEIGEDFRGSKLVRIDFKKRGVYTDDKVFHSINRTR